MKKRNSILLLSLLVILLSACHHHGHRIRTVRVNNNNETMKIEYCGNVSFNDDETAIEALSPDGYIKYRCNNKRFIVECDEDGDIEYSIYKGSRQLDNDDEDAKEIVNTAIKDIADHYNR
jgi:hypothetical protein